MKDRVPAYPGRVKLTYPDGTQVTVTLERADEPVVVGSAYSKANVLPDEVCDALGIDREDSEPKDAFEALKQHSEAVFRFSKNRPSTFEKLMTGRLI